MIQQNLLQTFKKCNKEKIYKNIQIRDLLIIHLIHFYLIFLYKNIINFLYKLKTTM